MLCKIIIWSTSVMPQGVGDSERMSRWYYVYSIVLWKDAVASRLEFEFRPAFPMVSATLLIDRGHKS